MSGWQLIPSSTGDLFVWITSVQLTSNTPGAAGQSAAADQIQIDSDRFFVLMGWLGSTNYDNAAGDFIAVIGGGPAAARTLVSPPTVPNNFEVQVRYNNDIALFGAPIPQACLCSDGYRTGNQEPIPTIFAPMSTFDATFWNVAPTLLTLADRSTALNLQVTFGMYGYFVPIEKLSTFLLGFRAYQLEAQKGLAGWIKKFTALDMSAVPGV